MSERAPAYTPVVEHLPPVYQEDVASWDEISGFLAPFDALLREILGELEELPLWLSPDMRALHPPGLPRDARVDAIHARYLEVAHELASWFGHRFPDSWQEPGERDAELDRKRAFLRRAARLWRRRGTPRGFYAWLCFSFALEDGERPIMIEHFRYRTGDPGATPASGAADAFAHRVSLIVPLTQETADVGSRRELTEWVARNAPAHLHVRVCWIASDDARYSSYDATDVKAVRELLRTIATYTPQDDGIRLESVPLTGNPQNRLGHGTLPGPARHDTEG